MIRMPGQSHQGPLPPLTDEQRRLEQELHSHVQMLAGQIGERNVFHHDRLVMAADYIRATLASAGYEVRRQPYKVEENICENVEAEVRGKERPDDIILIGAHYDSVQGSPGANDNASGVAAMLALARTFAKTSEARTLRFVAFTNEEPPHFQTEQMGSRVYAKRSRERGETIVLMLSLETIGYYSDEPESQHFLFPLNLIYPSVGNFIAFVSNTENEFLVQRLVGSFRRQAKFPSEGGALWGCIPGVGWSDHWAFWKEGFPGVMVTDTAPFRYPAYHSYTDRPELVQYERMARVVSGLRAVIAEMANASK
ncbi:MAG: M28 family peptidase [Nitrospirae bacterium]|nr:M28 family peptidase [Nitrospirota bacterium]